MTAPTFAETVGNSVACRYLLCDYCLSVIDHRLSVSLGTLTANVGGVATTFYISGAPCPCAPISRSQPSLRCLCQWPIGTPFWYNGPFLLSVSAQPWRAFNSPVIDPAFVIAICKRQWGNASKWYIRFEIINGLRQHFFVDCWDN